MSDSELLFVIDRDPLSSGNQNLTSPIKTIKTEYISDSEEKQNGCSSTDSDDIGHTRRKFRRRQKHQPANIVKPMPAYKNKNVKPNKPSNKNEDTNEIGSWEKYTKGIGSKLLAKYNYTQGTGLGPTGKGIVNPIEATTRLSTRVCIGASSTPAVQHKSATIVKKSFRQAPDSDSDDDTSTMAYNYKRKSPETIARNVKQIKLDTALNSQFIRQSLLDGSGLSAVSHGLEKPSLADSKYRFYHSYSDLSSSEDEQTQNEPIVPQITQSAEHEVDEHEVAHFLTKFAGRMENCDHTNVENFFPFLEDAIKTFEATSKPVKIVAERLLVTAISQWHPIRNMFDVIDIFTDSQEILPPKIYEEIFKTTWNKTVVGYIETDWTVTETQDLIDLIHGWRPQIPENCLNSVFKVIVEVLSKSLNKWNPILDEVPPHKWLIDWHELLGSRLRNHFQIVRTKLGLCLDKWTPLDESVLETMLIWKSVFTTSELEDFFVRYIEKRMKYALETIFLTSNNPDNPLIRNVVKWSGVVDPTLIEDILATYFLPTMKHKLEIDLRNAMENRHQDLFKEIALWYQKWTKEIPDRFRVMPKIKDQTDRMLKLMMRAKSGKKFVSGNDKEKNSKIWMGSDKSNINTNIKEKLEEFAQSSGKCFYPLPGKFHNFLQIYQFNDVRIIIDKDIIQMFSDSNWVHTPFMELLAM